MCNVHNYLFSFVDTRAIKDFLFVLGSGIEVHPTCCIGILLGDFNIKAEHQRSFKIGQTHGSLNYPISVLRVPQDVGNFLGHPHADPGVSCSLGKPPKLHGVRGPSNHLFSRQRLAAWTQLLSTWIEISQPMPTHFDISSKTSSRIGRCWIFGPSNLLIKMHLGFT